MLQKIKNWIIKKLGGYTEQEYHCNRVIEHVPVHEEKDYITLYAEQKFEKLGLSSFSVEDIKRYFIDKFTERLLPFIELNIEYLSDRERLVKVSLNITKVSGYRKVYEDDSRELIDVADLIKMVEESIEDNHHTEPLARRMHNTEHRHFLHMIDRCPRVEREDSDDN